ncbi:MAG TPA: alpha/beta hydrolase-fold protein [Longimicrobium sp.]|nr:alpha/beta hydrolase-fold protein [Longimicrobium sp.]
MRTAIETLLLSAALALGAATPAGAQATPPPHDSFTVASRTLSETRRINVYTPPAYGARGDERFPVLYLLDGGVAEDWPHVAATVDAAIRAGEMRPMLMVGIENTERRRDLTGPTEVEDDRKIAPRVGGSAAFRRFVADELVPEIARRYRVTDERALMGESLAGLFVVETFFAEPELFGTYLAFSPSLWWNAEALVRGAPARFATRPELRKALYFSSADEDNIAPAAARLAETLRARAPAGLRWSYTPRPDLTHGTIYRAELPGALRAWLGPAGDAR